MRTLAAISAVAVSALALTGCVSVPLGPVTSQDYEIADATAVVLETSGDLTISEGAPSLTVKAPGNIHSILTAEVRDGVLVLGRQPGPWLLGLGNLSYELQLPALERVEIKGAGDVDSTVSGDVLTIEVQGAGDVDVTGIDARRVVVSIKGAGDVTLAGNTEEQAVSISGAGDVHNEHLSTEDATVRIAGAGQVRLHVTATLDAEISGTGSVRYSGDPRVTSRISGLGGVTRAD